MTDRFRATSQPRAGREHGFSVIELIIVVAVIMVLAALSGKAMWSAVANYRMDTAAREIAGSVQMAKMKATARDARYQVLINTTAGTYRIQRLTAAGGTWELDPGTDDYTLPSGVSFRATAAASAPTGHTAGPNTEMTFNTRGLLIQNVTTATASLVDSRCFYMESSAGARSAAVCTGVTGKTAVYRLTGSAWDTQ